MLQITKLLLSLGLHCREFGPQTQENVKDAAIRVASNTMCSEEFIRLFNAYMAHLPDSALGIDDYPKLTSEDHEQLRQERSDLRKEQMIYEIINHTKVFTTDIKEVLDFLHIRHFPSKRRLPMLIKVSHDFKCCNINQDVYAYVILRDSYDWDLGSIPYKEEFEKQCKQHLSVMPSAKELISAIINDTCNLPLSYLLDCEESETQMHPYKKAFQEILKSASKDAYSATLLGLFDFSVYKNQKLILKCKEVVEFWGDSSYIENLKASMPDFASLFKDTAELNNTP